jgi:aminopeptidase-like protein
VPTASAVNEELLSDLFDELFPICRSITGPGLRESLDILARYIPLDRERVPSGTKVFDWVVPPEWQIEKARLVGPDGSSVVDFADSNLHVVNYSEPVDRRLSLNELKPHLHSLPHLPDAIPYATSYYKRTWGFCLSDRVLRDLPEGTYHARIDSRFVEGGVDFAQCVLPGESDAEILLASYFCHPSLANNELSGPLVLLGLYDRVRRWSRRRFTYRFLVNPETIGSLCFLHRYGNHLSDRLEAGLVLTCLGGPETQLSYKYSRSGGGLIDRLIGKLWHQKVKHRPFDPRNGSDERQYCSPGFNLPMGQMARTVYGQYEGYHNSLDSKEFMGIGSLVQSIDELESLLRDVEIAGRFRNTSPYGEPQLGRRDLYPNTNVHSTRNQSTDTVIDARTFLNRSLVVLNYSDGKHDMIQIAGKCGCSLQELEPIIERLEEVGLLVHDHGEQVAG